MCQIKNENCDLFNLMYWSKSERDEFFINCDDIGLVVVFFLWSVAYVAASILNEIFPFYHAFFGNIYNTII